MVYTDIGNLFLILSTFPAVISVAVFARVKWWRSRWGRHLMTYMSAMALVLVLGCLRIFYVNDTWFPVVRAGAYTLLVYALWWRMFYIIQAANEGSPNESPKESE